jgi:hypothetical protein
MNDPITCDDCGSDVQLARGDLGRLRVTCDCEGTISVKVAKALPEGWSA